jgi:hypothetical protein
VIGSIDDGKPIGVLGAHAKAWAAYQDMKIRHHTFDEPDLESSTGVIEAVADACDAAFSEELGLSVRQAVGLVHRLNEFCRPALNNFPVCFIHREHLADVVKQNFGLSPGSVLAVLSGLTLLPEQMATENKALYVAKREHQARYRPFALLPHPTGPHLQWDPAVAERAMIEVVERMSFGRLPVEWRKPAVQAAVERARSKLANGFVQEAKRRFEAAGWRCVTEVKVFKNASGTRHEVGNDPGEMDILALSPGKDVLLHLECKRVYPSENPRTASEDLQDFFGRDGKDGFISKATRKHKWLEENSATVLSHLQTQLGLGSLTGKVDVRTGFLTLAPNFAATRSATFAVMTGKLFFQQLRLAPNTSPIPPR